MVKNILRCDSFSLLSVKQSLPSPGVIFKGRPWQGVGPQAKALWAELEMFLHEVSFSHVFL